MKSLDTNTLLRLVLADIPRQASVVEELLANPKQIYAVADMVFAEIVRVLQGNVYSFDRPRIAANLGSIIAIRNINCNRTMLEKAIPLYVKHPKISFVDACLTVYAELNGATPLLTFDNKLAMALPNTVSNL